MKHITIKKLLTLSSISFLSLVTISCGSNEEPTSNPPDDQGGGGEVIPPEEEITLSALSVTERPYKTIYEIGEELNTLGIKVIATFSDSSTKNVSKEASYSPTTFTTANEETQITVSYTYKEVTKYAYFTVEVDEPENPGPIVPSDPTVTSITVTESVSLDLYNKKTQSVAATVNGENNPPQTVTWESLNTNVVTVSNGVFTAVAVGNTRVKVTSTYDTSKFAYVSVSVTDSTPDDPGPVDPTDPEDEGIVLPAIDYVKVFAPSDKFKTVYGWTNTATVTKGWPGDAMVAADDYGTSIKWMTYDFVDYTEINFIFSDNGNGKTADLSAAHAGYYWYYKDALINTNTVPQTGKEPEVTDIAVPTSNYNNIKEAKTADDLPAVKNYNKGEVVSPYTGNRTDFRDESIYFTITTRFYDGDSSNNDKCWDGRVNPDSDPAWRGDFKGLIEKMDYIKALGFTAIWITPIVKNASGYDYHGYHAINFKEVDPRYLSTDVAFIDVIRAAHSRDMKIILDVVFNHTSNNGEENLFPMVYYNPGVDSSQKGVKTNYASGILPSNYDSLDGTTKYNIRTDSMKGPKDTGNVYHHEKSMAYEQYIEQTGSMAGDCVDLNTENPAVANYLVEAFGEFIRLGVDAFRIDTMKHISRLTFNNYIWPGLYKIAEKCHNNHFYMFGEVCQRVREVWNHGQACDSAPFYTWKESKDYAWGDRLTNEASTLENWNNNANMNQPTSQNAYLANGYTYHTPDYSRSSGCSVIDFPMHWNFRYARDAYNVAVSNDQYYNDASYNVVYVDSHDYGPDGVEKIRYNEGTDAWKENMSLMFTFRGVPCIYYGSEVEFQKGKVIDVGPNSPLSETGRAYYGDYLKGNVTATDFGVFTASGTVQNTLNSTLSKHLQMLNKIRLKVPALRRGQYTSVGNMAYVRRYTYGGIDSLAVVAVTNGAEVDGLPNGRYVDLVTGTVKNVSNGHLSISLYGQGSVAVYVLDNGASGTLGIIS